VKKIITRFFVFVALMVSGCTQSTADQDKQAFWEGYRSIAPGVVMVHDSLNNVNCYLSVRSYPGALIKAAFPISCVALK